MLGPFLFFAVYTSLIMKLYDYILRKEIDMWPFKKKDVKPTAIDLEYEAVLHDMSTMGVATEEYQMASNNLLTIAKIKEMEKVDPKPKIDPQLVNLLVTGALSIAELLLILYFERTEVITSKALGFMMRLKR